MYTYYITDVNDISIFTERWNFGNYSITSMIECNFTTFCIRMRHILNYMTLSTFSKFRARCALPLSRESDPGCIRLCYMITL